MTIAAIIALIILGLLVIFQLSLVFGAPFGHFAWGGQHRILPTKLRIGSAVSIPIYIVIGLFAAARAGFLVIDTDVAFLRTALLAIAIYLTAGVIMNAASRSKLERYTMTPVALALAACFYILSAI